MDSAAFDEELGDRWLTSDLSKALRFYQSAFEAYTRAIKVSEEQLSLSGANVQLVSQLDRIECYYNALRLLLVVYNQYYSSDCVDISQLGSAPEVLGKGTNSVLQDIDRVISNHENAILVLCEKVSTDLFFNTALAYAEVVESLDSESKINGAVIRALALLQQVFAKQTQELRKSLDSANASETNLSASQISTSQNDTQFTQSNTAQPLDIMETEIAFFNLWRAYVENESTASQNIVLSEFQRSLLEMDAVVDDLSVHYPTSDTAIPVNDKQRNEYLIAKEFARSSLCDIQDAFTQWDNPALPDTAERYMLAADAIQMLIDRKCLSANRNSGSVEVFWAALCKMNVYLKKSQELLLAVNVEMKKTAASDRNFGQGTIILQICTVYIARADVDQQRSRLDHPEGVTHREVLRRNAIAFLKNAAALSKQSGGLRETAMEKLQRKKRGVEAQVRLLMIEGNSQEAIASQLENNIWQEEYLYCQSCWFYN